MADSERYRLYANHLEEFNSIAEKLTLSTTIAEVLEQVAVCAEGLVGAKRVSYCELEPDGQHIRLLGLAGEVKDHTGQIITLKDSGLSKQFSTGKGTFTKNLANAKSAKARSLHRSGLNHVWHQPIVCNDNVEGVLNIASPSFELHTDDACSLVETLSRLTGLTIQRIKARGEIEQVLQQLVKQSTTDSLTGLCNRSELRQRLQTAMSRAQAQNTVIGIMFLDLDQFKPINDTLGHTVGDAVLKVVAKRIENKLKPTHTVARVGGDEFIILLPDINSSDELRDMATLIIRSLKNPITSGSFELEIGASIGLCCYPHDGNCVDTLVKNADIAMYRAKDLGRNQYHFYTEALGDAINRKVALSRALSSAIANNEFRLVFQPQVNIASGLIESVEVLLRWEHPEEGDISPDVFIPIAENSGLISDITSWVLENALSALASWRQIQPELQIAINVSAKEFSGSSYLIERVMSALKKSNLPPQALELELTETALLTHPEKATDLVKQLSNEGIRLAIDDFGTGYASMSYLIQIPIDTIKIDRSFVSGIETDKSKQAVVKGIISIATDMQLTCVGEGVETVDQLNWLQQHGCHYAQGFYVCKAVSFSDLELMLAKQHSAGGLTWLKSPDNSFKKGDPRKAA